MKNNIPDNEKLNKKTKEAVEAIGAMVEERREKLQEKDLESDLDRLLIEQTRKLHEERKAHYDEKGDRKRSSQLRKEKAASAAAGPETDMRIAERKSRRKDKASKAAYEAHVAKLGLEEKPHVSEGPIRRTVRLILALSSLHKEMKGKSWYTTEKKKAAVRAVFEDCWQPVTDGLSSVLNDAWNFICRLCSDFIDFILMIGDGIIGAAFYVWSVIQWLWDCIWDLRYKLELHKHLLFRGFAVIIVTVAGVAFVYSSSIGYEYSYYGRQLGTAKSKEDVLDTIEILGDKLSAATGTNAVIDVERDIKFKQVIVGLGADCDSKDEILNNLTYMKDLQVQGYALSVNGVRQVILENEDAAYQILDDIRDSYALARSGVEYTEIAINEDTSVSEVSVLLGEIWNKEDATHYLKTGTTRNLAGEEDKPLLNVKTTELQTYTEEMEYGTQYIDNASLYIGETELKSVGVAGIRKIVAEIERVNGVETGRELVSSDVEVEPVDQVIYRGTKAIPVRTGTGTFAYPIKTYTISSRFGMRWGRMHTGVDFAAATGTKIFAADGGVVTYAGWKNSYGNIVIISHGGLYETYYAHCSQILVSEGDSVFQGQTIALVGSTGNSTGPHLHFEVRYNGEPGDPLGYL